MLLSQLKIGQKARILAWAKGANRAYRERLVAMGLLPGTEITLLGKAPFGDPVQIEVRGFSLSLRQKEADILQLGTLEGLL